MIAAPEIGDLLTEVVGCFGSLHCEDGLHPVDESHVKEEVDETALGIADARLFRGISWTRRTAELHGPRPARHAVRQ